MRLIDADAEIKMLKNEILYYESEIKTYNGNDEYKKYMRNSAKGKRLIAYQRINFLESLTTAYDVGAVIERIDQASDVYEFNEQGKENVRMVNFNDAVEAIKAGGRDE